MPLPPLGPRKAAIIALTPPCAVGAEIGADHGITSAHLVEGGICGRMIVSDISAASLDKARRLFSLHGIGDRAEFIVADGLEALTKPVGAIVIAGMGAETIVGMLERGKERVGEAALVLQSNTRLPVLRRWLMENGFRLDAERLVFEEGRFYIIIRAVIGRVAYSDKELFLGPCLLRERPALLADYLTFLEAYMRRRLRADISREMEWIGEEMHR